MTRRVNTPRVNAGRVTASDPYGIGPARTLAAPVLAVVGLVVIAVVSFGLLGGQLPIGPSTDGNGVNNPGPNRTAAPSNVIIVPEPELPFKGSIVYAKAGNIWLQTGTEVTQLTESGVDSMPSWSPDGEWIWFIRGSTGRGRFPAGGGRSTWYDITIPELMRMRPDGSGAESLANGRYRSDGNTWFYWIRQPAVAPGGETVAVVSDGPDPTKSNVVLQLFDVAGKKFSKPKVVETPPLGHQDPAWRPDGKILLLVKNGRDGSRGAPQIMRFDPATGKSSYMTGPGYLAPAWSPDMKYVAATKTAAFGTDVVVLDAKTGSEVLRVTRDEHSFSPIWSPAGDAIAFLHLDGQIVDLMLARLDGPAGKWTIEETIPLTELSGLDASSHPSWFIPASELPPPSPSPSPSGASPSSESPSASAAP